MTRWPFQWQCDLSDQTALSTLGRAFLPIKWQGKGIIGQVQGNAFWMEYRSPFYRSGFGPRLVGEIVPDPEHPESSLIQARWGFHRGQLWAWCWCIGIGLWAADSLAQALGYTFLFTTEVPESSLSLPWLALFFGLFFLRWSALHERQGILHFLAGTLNISNPS